MSNDFEALTWLLMLTAAESHRYPSMRIPMRGQSVYRNDTQMLMAVDRNRSNEYRRGGGPGGSLRINAIQCEWESGKERLCRGESGEYE